VLTVLLRRGPASIAAVAVAVFALAAPGADQGPASIARRSAAPILANIRVESNLVLIPVSVTDSKNHAVTGLGRESFRVFEGHTEQPVLHFAREDAPLSVGIVFDSSGSMRDKLAQSREAVARFLAAANPQDEFFVVDFDSTARLAVPFTDDAGGIESKLLFTGPEGRTALLDAVCLAMDYMKRARNPRKALLIISDGGENNSRYSETEIRRRVQESDLWIYAIGIYGAQVVLPEAEHGSTLLADLAEASGGRHFALTNAAGLPEAARNIALDLHNQYVIGYRPASTGGSGKYHRVQVKVSGRDLHPTWRPGYFE
jgi:Ca-activated chloride channel homolog